MTSGPSPRSASSTSGHPGVLQAQNAWMASIDSLRAPGPQDARTDPHGVHRHCRASPAACSATPGWPPRSAPPGTRSPGSILLTEPAFGIVLAIQALPAARRGYKQGLAGPHEEDDDGTRSPNDARVIVGHAPRPDETLTEFRREFEAWLDEHLPPPEAMAERVPPLLGAPAGLGPHLPARPVRGGLPRAGMAARARRPQRHARGADGLLRGHRRAQAPRSLNPQGLSICAASIVEFGTDDQKERFVVPTLKGEITWCLGMSEPNAGSDLASLTHQGRAPRRPLRGERAEGVDVGRPRRRLLPVLRAHRPRGAQAPRHQRAHHRHADARHHVPAPARADRPAPRRLQRGLLHRRGGARGEPARRAATTAGRSARDRSATSGGCSGS